MVKVVLNGKVIHDDAEVDGITAPVLYDHESAYGPRVAAGRPWPRSVPQHQDHQARLT